MERLTVAIADDHSVVTEGIRIILKTDPRFSVEGVFSNGEDLLNELCVRSFDIIILDIDLPGGEDFRILKEIKRTHPKCRVIIFTMHVSLKYFFEAKNSGADSFVVKTESITFLPTILIRAIKGDFYVSPELSDFFVDDKYTKPIINPQELEIVNCLAKGMYYNQIGEIIGKSEKTVEYHLARLRKKFEVQNNIELIKKLDL
ncbi:MAG: response regulator transcription factor [Leptospiraceae bacterium]|nr:response regulator transcription factor [Leptospiraceae bacterium]MCP5513614.1 response regulator transcription factor [Leptospiraceae bacterium]